MKGYIYEKLPAVVLKSLPQVDAEAIHKLFLEEWKDFRRKIVVLDDDPTGVQTVHDVNVYTDWSAESLNEGMQEENCMFFILTNSRSFTKEETIAKHKELARQAARSAADKGKEILVISRGDSTLRGYYPLEPEVLRETLEEELGIRIHGQILCPYFHEGGRYTIDSVHYVKEGEWLVPAGQTEFAGDKTFGYRESHLGAYLEEKSSGRYRKEDGIYITLSLLRAGKYDVITDMLMKANDFQPIFVDAAAECDVEVFAICLLRAMKAGKEFLIRSAAAVPKVLGNVSSRSLLARDELLGDSRDSYGGIVLIGSHVKKTTMQLEALQSTEIPNEFIEFHVDTCFREGGLEEERKRVIQEAENAMEQGKTAVVFTSRKLLAPKNMSKEEMLKLSVEISNAVTGVIAGLHRKPRFLIAKGGITSSDVGTKALQVRKALVLGQAQPGIPVWKTGPESKFPGLSYIIFPGNVGDTYTLKKIVETLA